ncbi:MAG: FkbM family methyltransferase [Rhodospirillales bacterium]
MQFAHTEIAGYRWVSNPNDQYIGKSLQTYGEWSYGEIVLLSRYLAPDARIVEVGANIGAHTVPLARLVPDGHVIAFEPQRLCFQMLCANAINNDCINITPYNMAVGNAAGSVQMADIDPRKLFNFGGIGVAQDTIKPASAALHGETPVVRLDDMIGDAFPVNLIKCDAEGMELNVIQGAASLIAKHKPILYLEDDRTALSQALYEAVRGMGYEVWWHPVPLFRADNLAGNDENIFGRIYSLSLFCCHPSRPLDLTELQKIERFEDHPLVGRLSPDRSC